MPYLTLLLLALSGCHYAKSQTECQDPVYCQGRLLDTIQTAGIYNDSKQFVDMVQKNSQNVTLANFAALVARTGARPSKEDLEQFVQENFDSEGELEPWTPPDLNDNPAFLNRIKDGDVRSFAKALIKIWPTLGRRVKEYVNKEQDRHSIIPLPNGFIIPGGRFSEAYYWDTYWIIKGLLLGEMTETVRGILENFVSLIQRFGFIPNGSRVYYLNRSQPPLFAPMVKLYIDSTKNITWLKKNIQFIEQEIEWWLENRTVKIRKCGKTYKLAQFRVQSGIPRAESYREDVETCKPFENSEKERCYNEIKAAAESGWDFSSRWLFNQNGSISTNLTTIRTSELAQVDLNAFLCLAIKDLSNFYQLIGDKKKSSEWAAVGETWTQAIEAVLYNKQDAMWYDWDIHRKQHRKAFYPSNFAPLWADVIDPSQKETYGKNAVKYLNKNKITQYLGGIPTSLLKSGQQWDCPNAWPPLQDLVVRGLRNTGNSEAIKLSKTLATNVVKAYMIGYDKTEEMFEKYDAVKVGEYGGGGEYVVQTGFGWTNGIALEFINSYFTS
ncbi:unnamed protein product [Phyllotreta striolata]|uniref:Trehalase n=1 Tax=Phyllotreta striolata TaxID=444603 RepID=A0A9N9TRH8_PHYSR|nr:unnamed protein product [Phyllotreta striolata]